MFGCIARETSWPLIFGQHGVLALRDNVVMVREDRASGGSVVPVLHFRQNARVMSTTTGRISRRPRIIAIAQTQLWKSVRLA